MMVTSGAGIDARGAAPDAAFKFCSECGARLAFVAPRCPHCGTACGGSERQEDTSDKSYGVAIALCGVFGIIGIHHFYIGNYLHGILDLALFIGFVWLYAVASPFAILVLIVDLFHTAYVFFMLIVGKQRDGNGKIIRQPV